MKKSLSVILTLVLIVSILDSKISCADIVKNPRQSFKTTLAKFRHSISSIGSIKPKKKCKFSQEKLDRTLSLVSDGTYEGRMVFKSGRRNIVGKIKLVAGNKTILGSVQLKNRTQFTNLPLIFSKEGVLASSEDYLLSLRGRTLVFKSDRCVRPKSRGSARLLSSNFGNESTFKGIYKDEDGSTAVNIALDGSVAILTGSIFDPFTFFGNVNEEGSFVISSTRNNIEVSVTPALNNTLELNISNKANNDSETIIVNKIITENEDNGNADDTDENNDNTGGQLNNNANPEGMVTPYSDSCPDIRTDFPLTTGNKGYKIINGQINVRIDNLPSNAKTIKVPVMFNPGVVELTGESTVLDDSLNDIATIEIETHEPDTRLLTISSLQKSLPKCFVFSLLFYEPIAEGTSEVVIGRILDKDGNPIIKALVEQSSNDLEVKSEFLRGAQVLPISAVPIQVSNLPSGLTQIQFNVQLDQSIVKLAEQGTSVEIPEETRNKDLFVGGRWQEGAPEVGVTVSSSSSMDTLPSSFQIFIHLIPQKIGSSSFMVLPTVYNLSSLGVIDDIIPGAVATSKIDVDLVTVQSN